MRLPLVPVVVTPDDEGWQDSTPIIERLEADFPEPSIHPGDPVLAFLSALVEEYGDEWGNKLMFHHRWWRDVDQLATAWVLARGRMLRASDEEVERAAGKIRHRMVERGHFVGSSEATAPLISACFRGLLDILEKHLASRPYLFGACPAFADFGLAPQIYECALDPGCAGIIRAGHERTLSWCYRMMEPRSLGPFETWASLESTLTPLLHDVGHSFLPWSVANAAALAAGQTEFEVQLETGLYRQHPQKYHAKSLKVLQTRYALVADKDKARLDPILEKTGCKCWLSG